MHRRTWGLFLAAFFLSACSGVWVAGDVPAGGGKMKDQASPEEDPLAPGMIPKECERLLNQAKEWGYSAAENGNWRPASRDQALEVAKFFSAFYLVPQSTSDYTRVWLRESVPSSEAEATQSLERMARAQTCDLMLAHKMLLGVVNYRWTKEDRPKAAAYLYSFVLNQQARLAPSLARAVQIDVVGRLAQKGFVRLNVNTIKKIQSWFDAETAKGIARTEQVTSELGQWKLSREEVLLSEQAREKLGRVLPLP